VKTLAAAACALPLLVLLVCANQAPSSREGRTAAAEPAAARAPASPPAQRDLVEDGAAQPAAAPKVPRKLLAVAGSSGTIRCLRPLPVIRTKGSRSRRNRPGTESRSSWTRAPVS
jgi:hypothetical protein